MRRNGFGAPGGRLLCACAGQLAVAGGGRADELSDLKARLEAQEKQAEAQKKQIEALRRMLEASQPEQNQYPAGAGAVTTQKSEGAKSDAAKPLTEANVTGIVEKY